MKKICKNCKLFNAKNSLCNVIILFEGQRNKIPVDPRDPCFFEQSCFDPITGEEHDLNEIQEVKFWIEDEKGNKTDKNGIVKIQYPEGFFGDMTINDIT